MLIRHKLLLSGFITMIVLLMTASCVSAAGGEFSFSDAFDQSKSDMWRIHNEAAGRWNLTEKIGSLRIYTTPTDTFSTYNSLKNLFYISLPTGFDNYQVTAKISFPIQPYQNHHMGGVALLCNNGGIPDQDNLIRMEYVYTGGGRRFETQYEEGRSAENTTSNLVDITVNTPYWVRIKKEGNTFTTYYSTNGTTYNLLSTRISTLNMAYAGIYAMHTISGTPEIPFDFDGFTIEKLPVADQAATPTIGTQPADVVATEGGTATFTVSATASDGGTLAYQWQKSTDHGNTWADINGAVSASYTTGVLADTDNGTQYRCVITNTRNATAVIAVTATNSAAVYVDRQLVAGFNGALFINDALKGTNQVASSGYVELDSGIALTGSYTEEVWIKATGVVSTNSYGGILGNEPALNAFGTRAPGIWYVSDTKTINAGFGDGADVDAASWHAVEAGDFLKDGEWNHVAVTFHAPDGKLTLYINGNKAAEETFSGKTPCATPVKYIGKVDNSFAGYIDEVRVWNTALSQATIRKWMNREVAASHEDYASLQGYFQFDSVSGTTAHESKSGLDGTVKNTNYSDWVVSTVTPRYIAGQSGSIPVYLESFDAGGGVLGYSIIDSPGKGTLTGTFPDLTYIRTDTTLTSDSFTYKVNDGTKDSTNTGTVYIEVQPVAGISVKTQPTKLDYEEGQALDLSGLTVALAYGDGSASDVPFASFGSKIAASPANGTILLAGTHNGQPVVLTHTTYNASTNNLIVTTTASVTYTLTYTAGANGSISGTTPQTVNHGGSGTAVTAVPDAGYHFVAWSDGLTTAVRTDSNVTGDISVTATFARNIDAAVPNIDTQPADCAVNIGETATLSVVASGGVVLSYQWYSNPSDSNSGGMLIAGAESSSYSVLATTTGVSYYYCVVTNTDNGATGNKTAAITTNTAKITVNPPGTPIIQSAVAGNAHITITWNNVAGATGYKVYSSTVSGSYGDALASVGDSVYSYDAAGLTNGTTYYFVVKAIHPGGDSEASNEVSAIPRTLPGAPTNVTASAGDGEATVSFAAPVEDGGSMITGYIVTSDPGNITAAGTGTAIRMTGLTNGTTYTFTVQAVNAAGNGPASAVSNAVTPYRPSNDNSSESGSASAEPAETKKPDEAGVEILVNGKGETMATVTTTRDGDKTVATVVLDDKKVEEKLQKEGNHTVLTIPVKNAADVVIGQLNGQTVKNMEAKEAVIELKTGNATYTLPASQINIDDIAAQIGKQVELKDIAVNIKISAASQETVKIVEDTANKNHYQVVVGPIDFEITCTSGDKTVDVSRFNGYVERLVTIPEGIDPARITTGIVLNPDGTFSHVPTTIILVDGKYYAKINSLTNSTYSVIRSPKSFKDVEKHWAKEAANDMASRLVIGGTGEDLFEPEMDVTRAEFADALVRALGLMRPGTGKDAFNDVPKGARYYDAVSIAYEYGIISGYGNGKFGPADKTTREQAMTMIARAMKITGLKMNLSKEEPDKILEAFADSYATAGYAKSNTAACVKAGTVMGRNGKLLAPKDDITRAETAAIIRRLLQISRLI